MLCCPSIEELMILLNEDREDPQALLDHLSVCERCREVLDQLGDGTGDWKHWEQLLQHKDRRRALSRPRQAYRPDSASEQTLVTLPEPLSSDQPTKESHSTEATAEIKPLVGVLVFPGYEILEEIGRGGMGVVYKARQLSLRRLVALKTLQSNGTLPLERRARFQREAQAIARLHSSRIVQIYEVGEHAGQLYFSMELVQGGTLAASIQHTPQSPGHAAIVVEELARGAHVAHLQGIVHRDLKPANVLLVEEEDPPKIKITDFGLAKDVEESNDLTSSGMLAGTLSYIAPEQARANREQISPRTDVHALGVILYEMLTGHPPFTADNPAAALRQIVQDDPVAPSHLQRTVPGDLETICLKCLEKDPGRRYGSALDLAEDLSRFRSNKPIQARRVGLFGKSWRWSRRHPITAVLVLLCTITLLTGVIGANIFAWKMRAAAQAISRERNNVVHERDVARKERDRAEEQKKQVEREKEKVKRLLRRVSVSRFALQLHLAQRDLAENRIVAASSRLEACDRDLCSWEHAHLLWRCHQCLAQSLQAPSGVHALAFSPDGAHLMACSRGIIIWNWRNGNQVFRAPVHPRSPAVFTPNGKSILIWTPSRPGSHTTVKQWSITTGQCLQSWDVPVGAKPIFTNPPPGKPFLILKKGPEELELLSPTGNRIDSVPTGSESVFSVARSSNGNFLAVVERARGQPGSSLTVWDTTGSKPKAVLAKGGLKGARPPSVFFTHDSKGVFIVGDRAAQWHALLGPQQKPKIIRLSKKGNQKLLGRSPDSKYLVTRGAEGIALWDLTAPSRSYPFRSQDQPVTQVALTPDNRYLATATLQGALRVWDLHSSPEPCTIQQHQKGSGGSLPIAISPNGQWVATACRLPRLRLGRLRPDQGWAIKVSNLKTGELVQEWTHNGSRLSQIGFSPSSDRLLGALADMTRLEWDFQTGKLLKTVPVSNRDLTTHACSWSSDGRARATHVQEQVQNSDGSRQELRRIWIQSLDEKRIMSLKESLAAPFPSQHGLALSPRGDLLAIPSADPKNRRFSIQIYDRGKKKITASIPAEWNPGSMVFSADGERLALVNHYSSSRLRSQICVWDLTTERKSLDIQVNGSTIPRLAFASGGDRLLVLKGGAGQSWLQIWDLPTQQMVMELSSGKAGILQARMTQDGKTLVTLDRSGAVKLWKTIP